MLEKTKTVFYCEFCKRHGLSRHAMEKHERHCTLNSERTCRWRIQGEHPQVDTPALAETIRSRAYAPDLPSPSLQQEDIDWLHDEVDGCPACMLAVLRQSGVEYHFDGRGMNLWNYGDEVESFRADERERSHREQQEDDYRMAVYGG